MDAAKGRIIIMNRRDLVMGGVAAGTVATESTASAKSISRTVTIEAPDDVHVEQLLAAYGPVKAGDPLFKLKSFNLESMKAKIDLFRIHIEIMERPFNDGRVDAEIEHLKQKAELSMHLMDIAQREYDRRNEYYKSIFGPDTRVSIENPPRVAPENLIFFTMQSRSTNFTQIPGGGSSDNPDKGWLSKTESPAANPSFRPDYNLQTELDKNTADYMDAKIAADQASLKKLDAVDKMNLTKTKLKLYERILEERTASMAIIANANGVFAPRAFVNSFVKKGHSLAELII